jgi:polysaccharide biosynthesis protein PslG
LWTALAFIPTAGPIRPEPRGGWHNARPQPQQPPQLLFPQYLEDYLTLLDRYGVSQQLWVTEFGWGSVENFNGGPAPERPFMDNVSEWEQAVYTMDAFALAHENDRIGPMMLWNLNFAPLLGPEASKAGYSVVRPDGSQRPLYLALQNVPRAPE